MAEEEANKVEQPAPESCSEAPPPKPEPEPEAVEAPPKDVAEEKSLIPPPAAEEKPAVDDCKALAIVESNSLEFHLLIVIQPKLLLELNWLKLWNFDVILGNN